MSCGAGCRCGSNLVLLWLWHRPGAAALIWPLAWEFPYATPVPPHKKNGEEEVNTKVIVNVMNYHKMKIKENKNTWNHFPDEKLEHYSLSRSPIIPIPFTISTFLPTGNHYSYSKNKVCFTCFWTSHKLNNA